MLVIEEIDMTSIVKRVQRLNDRVIYQKRDQMASRSRYDKAGRKLAAKLVRATTGKG